MYTGRGHGLLPTLLVCYTICYTLFQQGADKSPELAEIWARLQMGSTPTSSAILILYVFDFIEYLIVFLSCNFTLVPVLVPR